MESSENLVHSSTTFVQQNENVTSSGFVVKDNKLMYQESASNKLNDKNIKVEITGKSKNEIVQQNVKSTECENSIELTLEYEGTFQSNSDAEDAKIVDSKKPTISDLKNIQLNGNETEQDKPKVNVFVNDTLPQWYHVKGPLVSQPILSKNLVKAFEVLPIQGEPKTKADLEEFQNEKLRKFIGCNLDDEEFNELSKYCSPDHLKTGNEILLNTSIPTPSILPDINIKDSAKKRTNLNILKRCKLRIERDPTNKYTTRLKYRGVRLLPPPQENPCKPTQLQPGVDILYHIRIYRPFYYSLYNERCTRGRHSVFSCDIIFHGQQFLSVLRDRIICNNDLDLRVDVSNNPEALPPTTSKEVFPSGFLFINNVFYVDTREGCHDTSAVIRDWAITRGVGLFPKKDMCKYRFDDLVLKLGYPEVYVHQGNCEHLFTISEIRLVCPRDPLLLSQYPYLPSTSQNQTIYCTTCAEFGAKWVVIGSRLVPFDPAFFCDTCFKQYMYKDGKKIDDFKAYFFRGNEVNMLKPFG